MSMRSDLRSKLRMSLHEARTVVADGGEQAPRPGRDEGEGVDLPVRVVQGDADLRAAVLEDVDLLDAVQPGQLGGTVGPRLDDGAGPGSG